MKRLPLTCLVALAPVLASAGIVPATTSVGATGAYTWTYDFRLAREHDSDRGLPSNDGAAAPGGGHFGSFLTIFDFAGYVDGSCSGPAGWTCAVRELGISHDDVALSGRAALTALSWVYTESPERAEHRKGPDSGLFSAQSIYAGSTLVRYAERGTGMKGAWVGLTRGPEATEVAEPGSLALAGLALAVTGVVLPRRRTRR